LDGGGRGGAEWSRMHAHHHTDDDHDTQRPGTTGALARGRIRETVGALWRGGELVLSGGRTADAVYETNPRSSRQMAIYQCHQVHHFRSKLPSAESGAERDSKNVIWPTVYDCV